MWVTFFIIVLFIVGICLTGLSLSILLKKDGRFPEIHIGKNKHMKKKGIKCARASDKEERISYKPVNIK